MSRLPTPTDQTRESGKTHLPDAAVKHGGNTEHEGDGQPQTTSAPVAREPLPSPPPDAWRVRTQLVLSVLLAAGVLIWLLSSSFHARAPSISTQEVGQPVEIVRVVGPRLISITPGTPLEKKLAVVTASYTEATTPQLNVTGSIAARLRPGTEPAQDRWQFNASEVLSAYTDWQKSASDVEFNQKEVEKVRQLDEATVSAQQKVVDRLRKLVAIGTDSEKDLAAEETNLLQAQINGAKSVHEAETALKQAQRAQAALARQLQQAGVDPEVLMHAADGTAIVVADVPEAKMTQVRLDESCIARFFGFPDKSFSGKLSDIAPTLSKDRRTLRVSFVLEDPDDLLKPGMFAEIGIGTDARRVMLIPADGVLHVGRADYVLRETDSHTWQAREVKLGELQGQDIEILSGLEDEDRVIGAGAILLKPYVVRILQPATVKSSGAATLTNSAIATPEARR